jgi:hypothetical protein
MTHLLSRFTLAGILTGAVTPGPVPPPESSAFAAVPVACQAPTWTVPALVVPGDDGRHVARFPLVVSDSANEVVMGNDIVSYDGRPIPSRSLSVWRLDGHDLGRPPGDFAFAFPRGILRNGRLHMLWAEPSDETRTTDPYTWPGKLASVWAAEYEQQTGWSTPRQIFEGPVQAGGDRSAAATAMSASSLVEFGWVSQRDTASLLVFRMTETGWATVRIPVGPLAVYPSVVQTGPALVAAFLAPDEGHGYDDNSVYLVRSLDSGKTWTPRRLLSRSGHHPAFDTQLLVDSQQQLHLLWRREEKAFGVLGHMLSPDAGRSWTHPDGLALPGPAFAARGGIDRCGQVQVFYSDQSAGQLRPRIGHAIWNGTWHPDDGRFANMEAWGLTIHARADSALTLVFLGRDASTRTAGEQPPLRTFVSRLGP